MDSSATHDLPKSKEAPTKNKATPAAKKTHAARKDSLLPKAVYHNGKDRLELCGFVSLMIQGAKAHHIIEGM